MRKCENPRGSSFLDTFNESLITDRGIIAGRRAVSVTNRRDFAVPDTDKGFWRCATSLLKRRINHQWSATCLVKAKSFSERGAFTDVIRDVSRGMARKRQARLGQSTANSSLNYSFRMYSRSYRFDVRGGAVTFAGYL